ncbi:H/ACA ribonucleoprotein complex subunit 2-like protein [Planococcus citri]|uniref:H/ACA ribonucleoprotein complex subunit 2-like protein n=1 Tax=Planococcus citri TaxID=170843 RepID=UPI0031F8F4F8
MAEETKPEKLTYKDKLKFANAISKPMASKGTTKRLLKLIRKAAENKSIRVGLKDVQKQIRRGEKGIVVFGADVTPVDIMCHMPAICEEKDIPYCYTPSREDIGHAAGLHRTAVMVLVKPNPEYAELYEECQTEVQHLPVQL